MPKLVYVVPDINMGSRHLGLIKQMKDRGIEFNKMKNGDVVALLNRRESIVCVMAVLPEKDSFGFLGMYKSPTGRVPLEAIQFIAQSLGGSGLDMSKAIRLGLEKLLGKKEEVVIADNN